MLRSYFNHTFGVTRVTASAIENVTYENDEICRKNGTQATRHCKQQQQKVDVKGVDCSNRTNTAFTADTPISHITYMCI
jgi:hypothetical protein